MVNEKIALLEKLIQRKLECLPRAIEGNAPVENLKHICNDLSLLREILEIVSNYGKA